MSIAVMAKTKHEAQETCNMILSLCLSKGCYADFIPVEHGSTEGIKKYDTIVVIAEDDEILRSAEKLKAQGHKIILITNSNEIAAQTFETDIRFCMGSASKENVYNRVIDRLFSL